MALTLRTALMSASSLLSIFFYRDEEDCDIYMTTACNPVQSEDAGLHSLTPHSNPSTRTSSGFTITATRAPSTPPPGCAIHSRQVHSTLHVRSTLHH